jgi:hypothetical protein
MADLRDGLQHQQAKSQLRIDLGYDVVGSARQPVLQRM